MIISYGFLLAKFLNKARDAAVVKILKKQSGDLDSSEMFEFLIDKLNRIHHDDCLNIVIPNYLFNVLSFSSPIK